MYFKKEVQKHTAYLIPKYSLQHLPKLTKKPTPTAEQEYEKSPSEIPKIKKELAESKKNLQFTIKSTDKVAHLKSSLYQSMHANKSFNKNQLVEEPIAEVLMNDAGDDLVYDDDQPQATSKSKASKTLNPEWFKQPSRPPTPDPLTFNNLMATPIDFSKFVLNGLKIENPTQDILLGPAFNMLKGTAILGVKSVSVKKLHGYGHLKEIVVKISDQQLYKFKEGDFVDLDLNGIEDMLLLTVQHKLFYLDGSDIIDFILALRMFTRSLILKRRVEDLQLGVERYQQKLNITNPHKTFLEIEFKEPYTPSYDSPGIIYEDLDKQKVLDFRLDYNSKKPKRKWTAVHRNRSGLMIELMYKQLREREIIINLERLVGAWELEIEYKLMTPTS
nr:hypothetical protein [Tanacetum cinerariifolium]